MSTQSRHSARGATDDRSERPTRFCGAGPTSTAANAHSINTDMSAVGVSLTLRLRAIYAFKGSPGSLLWKRTADSAVIGSVVTANLGSGHQDVIVAATGGAEVLDGRDGTVIATLEKGVGLQNSALVTEDPNGTIGITVAGYNARDQGQVEHLELRGSNGNVVDKTGSWPMFHHDPRLSGNAEAPI